jgi:hypothetical protein
MLSQLEIQSEVKSIPNLRATAERGAKVYDEPRAQSERPKSHKANRFKYLCRKESLMWIIQPFDLGQALPILILKPWATTFLRRTEGEVRYPPAPAPVWVC